MYLYHAISSYQILAVICHRFLNHRDEKAILLLPDFIVEKYPQYMKLVELRIFDEVYLFPYLQIRHDRQTVGKMAEEYCDCFPFPLERFEKIYVAGAHFYFSLALIRKRLGFCFFEDAPGMLERADELYDNLKKTYPIHAEIARENGLLNGSCPFIKEIICMKNGFRIMRALEELHPNDRKKILCFFGLHKMNVKKKAVLFFTQHFANLGFMSWEEQKHCMEQVIRKLAESRPVIVKRHPDDKVPYYLPDHVKIIEKPFPAELLPYVLKPCPTTVFSFNSTGAEGMREVFENIFVLAEEESYAEIFKRKKERKNETCNSENDRRV